MVFNKERANLDEPSTNRDIYFRYSLLIPEFHCLSFQNQLINPNYKYYLNNSNPLGNNSQNILQLPRSSWAPLPLEGHVTPKDCLDRKIEGALKTFQLL